MKTTRTIGLISATCALALAATLARAAAPAATADPCGGSTRCYNAGTFIAEVMQVSATAMAKGVRHQSVALNIRFRNVSDKPMILAYRSASSAGLDNFGNGFTWGRPGTHDTSVKGIGMVAGKSVDTQFSLAPGQTRNATFNIIRFNAVPPIGNAWNYDVVIDEIEVLPGQVIRSARQNSLNFSGLTAGAFAAGGVTSGGDGATTSQAEGPLETAGKMLDLFQRNKKK